MKNISKLLLFWLLIFSVSFCEATIFKFDFGMYNSPGTTGMIPIVSTNSYTSGLKYGWYSSGGGRYYSRNDSYPDSVAKDWIGWYIGSAQNCQFRMDLANGTYTVVVMVTNPTPIRSSYMRIQGTTVLSETISLSNVYSEDNLLKGQSLDYTPGQDAFNKIIDLEYPIRTYSNVTVSGGNMLLYFNNYAVHMVAVFPSTCTAECTAWLSSLETTRKLYFSNNCYTEYLPTDSTPAPADDGKGYQLFTRNYVREVYPNTKPKSYELLTSTGLALNAAKGEYEPVTLGVYPLSSLTGVNVTVSDLTGSGGTIPGSNVDVRVVRYFEKQIWNDNTGWTKNFIPMPFILNKKSSIDIPAGLTKQYWLTVKVPDNAEAGTYTGTITFTPSNKTAATIPFTVTVRPFTLPGPEELDMSFGWMSNKTESRSENYRLLHFFDSEPTAASAKLLDILKKEFQDMKEHGFNSTEIPTPEISNVSGSVITLNWTYLNIYYQAMSETGFGLNSKYPNQMFIMDIANDLIDHYGQTEFSANFNTLYKSAITQILSWANSKSPKVPIVFWAVDEPRETGLADCNRNRADTISYLQLISQVPGAKSTVTVQYDVQDSLDYTTLLNYMDYLQTHPSSNSDGLITGAQDGDPVFWFYNLGKNVNRYAWGFYSWKIETKGNWQWSYHYWENPYYPFTSLTGTTWAIFGSVFLSSSGAPVPTTWYEWSREGIDDYRYIYKLETLISSATTAGFGSNSDVTAAGALLTSIRSSMSDYPPLTLIKGTNDGQAYSGALLDDLDGWRESISSSIVKISNLIASSDVIAPNPPANLANPARTTSSITLSWTASTQAGDGDYASYYRIYRGVLQVGTTTGISFTNTGLSEGTTYSYTVYAVDDANNQSSGISGSYCTSRTADITPPQPPTTLSSSAQTETSITLEWIASTQSGDGDYASYYRVYRESTLIGTPGGTTITDSGLTAETTYNYTVYAVDDAGNQSTTGVQGSFSTLQAGSDVTPPAIETAAATNKNTVRVTYSEPVDETSAETVSNYSINNAITITGAVLDVNLITVSLTVSDLTIATNYTVTVNDIKDRAATPNTIISNTQEDFVYTGDVTPPEKILNVKAFDNPADAGGKAIVTWTKSSEDDVLGYKVYFSSEPFSGISGATYFGGSPINNRDASSCTVAGLSVDTQPYYFSVLALDSSGNESAELTCSNGARAINNRVGEIVNGVEDYEITAGYSTTIKVLVPTGTNKGVYIDILSINGNSNGISEAALTQISQANLKTMSDSGIISSTVNDLSGTCTEFKAKLSLLSPVTIVMPYSSSITGETEDSLRIYELNETDSKWELVNSNHTVDKTNNTVSVSVAHFSIYRILGKILSSSNLSNVRVYPNPFKPNDNKSGTGTWATGIIFDNLTNNSTIKIYTMSGEHVVTLEETDNNGKYEWNVTDKSGKRAASGTYLYRITNPSGEKITGKIGVVK